MCIWGNQSQRWLYFCAFFVIRWRNVSTLTSILAIPSTQSSKQTNVTATIARVPASLLGQSSEKCGVARAETLAKSQPYRKHNHTLHEQLPTLISDTKINVLNRFLGFCFDHFSGIFGGRLGLFLGILSLQDRQFISPLIFYFRVCIWGLCGPKIGHLVTLATKFPVSGIIRGSTYVFSKGTLDSNISTNSNLFKTALAGMNQGPE